MVWHTHMLNPCAYLEDCIRSSHRALWHRGLPWRTVNSAISTSFEYHVSEDARQRWESSTGLPWENTACPMAKVITCPVCSTEVEAPWTTWDATILHPAEDGFVGHGYGDGDFFAVCASEACSYVIGKETLYAAKFAKDVERLLKGLSRCPAQNSIWRRGCPLLARLLLVTTHSGECKKMPFLDIFRSNEQVTMETVKEAISEAVKDLRPLSGLDSVGKGKEGRLFLRRHSKMATRKMLSRYVGNHSTLALDLVVAASRQSVFVDKMYKVGSPSRISICFQIRT